MEETRLSGLKLHLTFVNFHFQKALTVFGSALYGGAILATSLDYFLENSLMLKWVWDKVRVHKSDQPCWFSWAILGIWPASLLLGKNTSLKRQSLLKLLYVQVTWFEYSITWLGYGFFSFANCETRFM